MTNYEYTNNMMELYIQLSQIHKINGEIGLSNFYFAVSEGYEKELNKFSEKEAKKLINDEMLESLNEVISYLNEEKEKTTSKIFEILIILGYSKDKSEEVSIHFKNNNLTDEEKEFLNLVGKYCIQEKENN